MTVSRVDIDEIINTSALSSSELSRLLVKERNRQSYANLLLSDSMTILFVQFTSMKNVMTPV